MKSLILALMTLSAGTLGAQTNSPPDAPQPEACSTCTGRGVLLCRTCHGRGMVACPGCLGRKVARVDQVKTPCLYCEGKGSTKVDEMALYRPGAGKKSYMRATGNKLNQPCKKCTGQGHTVEEVTIWCEQCAATGLIMCPSCNNRRSIRCPTCVGTGRKPEPVQ